MAALEQRAGDLGEQRRLARAALGLGLAAARAGGEPADDDGSDEVDGERDPVLGVGEPEGVLRRQEEPVESEHARDGDRQRVGEAEEHGDGQDGEDVEDAEAEHRREGLEREDRASHDGHRREARQHARRVAG